METIRQGENNSLIWNWTRSGFSGRVRKHFALFFLSLLFIVPPTVLVFAQSLYFFIFFTSKEHLSRIAAATTATRFNKRRRSKLFADRQMAPVERGRGCQSSIQKTATAIPMLFWCVYLHGWINSIESELIRFMWC